MSALSHGRGALLALLALSACDRSLEVTGQTARVVGQSVSLQLSEGEPTFDGQLWLRAADGVYYRQNEIKATKKDERNLSFVVPSDVAVGAAQAIAWAGGGVYHVPLELNRLALTIDDKGQLEGWPLPPGTLAKPARSLGAGPALCAVSPGGGELVVATGGKLLIIELGAELKDATAGINLAGVTALAAVPGGALATTDTALYLIRYVKGGATTQTSLALTGLRAVAASETGDRAFALSACDTNSDTQVDSDCVTEVTIGASLVAGRRAILDAVPSASTLAATRDGRGAVVGDAEAIHGVWLEPEPAAPRLSKVAWVVKQGGSDVPYSAQPVSIDRAATVVKSSPTELRTVDLFAVAEKAKNAITFVAFNPVAGNDLQKTSEAVLPEAPFAVGYGRRTELVVAAGKSLYTLDAGQSSPASKKLGAQTGGAIQALAVQP